MMPARTRSSNGNGRALVARRVVARLVIAGLATVIVAFGGIAEAKEGKRGLLVTCPAYWPGLDSPGLPMDLSVRDFTPKIWTDFISIFHWDDDGFKTNDETIQLDCQYMGERHLTVLLPGADITCWRRQHPDAPKVRTLICESRTESGMSGPIVIQPAEPVTADTNILGLKLRQPLEVILAAAAKLGFAATITKSFNDGMPEELLLENNADKVTITFSNSSGLVEQIFLVRTPTDWSLFRSSILRHGFGYEWINKFYHHSKQWLSPDKSIEFIAISSWTNSEGLVLTDLAAGSGATVPPRGEKRKKLGFLVACPAHWPGLDKPGSPLDDRPGDSAAKIRTAEGALVDGDRFTARGQAPVHLDCRYLGDRHLSVLVPGDDIACRRTRHPDAAKVTTVVCQTRAETGMPGPIVIQPADKGSD